MATNVIIPSCTGNSPYEVWVCDDFNATATCVFIATITDSDLAYSFTLPPAYENIGFFCVKVIDSQGCVDYRCIPPPPSPSPSNTPSITPSTTTTLSITVT